MALVDNELDNLVAKGVFDQITDGICLFDINRHILFWNKAAELITGYTAAEMVGKYCPDCGLDDIDDTGAKLCDTLCPLLEVTKTGQEIESKVWTKKKDGQRLHIILRAVPFRDMDGKSIGVAVVFTDLTTADKLDATLYSISEMTIRDMVTNLYNRRFLSEMLVKQLALKKRGQISFGLILADIDHFKQINETYGHQVGDEILCQVATILNVSVRLPDLVARWGGEEFLMLVYTESMLGCKQLAERLRMLVEQHPFLADSTVTASFGCTLVKGDDTFEKLVDRTEKALLRAKEIGRNRVAMFE